MLTNFFLYLETLTESPYEVGVIASAGALVCLCTFLVICARYEIRHHRERRGWSEVRHIPSAEHIHQAATRIRSWDQPAKKGIGQPGFNRSHDDRVVDEVSQRRRELNAAASLGNRVH